MSNPRLVLEPKVGHQCQHDINQVGMKGVSISDIVDHLTIYIHSHEQQALTFTEQAMIMGGDN